MATVVFAAGAIGGIKAWVEESSSMRAIYPFDDGPELATLRLIGFGLMVFSVAVATIAVLRG